ncbi:albusnodin/ikarugamycin family macrolactam cyclase [Actinosynnema mirum]|uniref:asparagine synthase (glutamine-hydrolyzing) n=1 Tax=Actinosynnema mirum (strain ATCC 29888 / DSM 43827 / JCM 3225 / NBRC 14064 / NCIMB 13271 / NRRL B-12336 / IMRU 3971 / 101) TaxID=446462 RepID=C6WJ43_ACTMD|nr:albusnodin/ikarugamycin family macrolactam cyclase [Actinosynnema mirum]ACU40119.1 asparagine synthase [Actinosynnema mirum DSM 43827]
MRWLGGFSTPTAPVRAPDTGTAWPHLPGCWTVGEWSSHELRTTRTGRRTVALIGTCGATPAELGRMGACGVPDEVSWRWAGSYTTVEVTDEHVRVWTDLGGAWPLYLVRADGGVYWGTSSRALAGLTGGGLDLGWLAAWLVAPAEPLLLAGRSLFDGVTHVPAGHRLTLSPRGGSAAVRRVWWPRPRSCATSGSLRTELAAAVAVRVSAAARPTSDLSGGLDSTALALLAHHAPRTGQAVSGVTVHPAGRAEGGDLVYARAAAKRSGITHRLLPLSAEHAPYTGLDAIPVTDEPPPSTIAQARLSAQLRWMRDELGTDCHLTGDGGDTLLCTPPIVLADLLATGHARRGAIEAVRWARLRRLPVWPLLRTAHRTTRGSRRAALLDFGAALLATSSARHEEGDVGWCAVEEPPPWATEEARRRLANLIKVCADHLDEPLTGEFAVTATSEGVAEVGRSARADVQFAEAHGVTAHNPFTDSRVVDAYLSIPLDHRPSPADYKPMLRDAMSDLFPAELTARTTKGDFNADHYQGMRTNLEALHELADGRLAALGLVDPVVLRRTLTRTAAGLPGPLSHVEPAIAAEAWARVDSATPRIAWSKASFHRTGGAG